MEDKKRAGRILLVDDESAITANLAPFLERAGFAVTTAADGETALQLVQSLQPDLTVLDVLMPQMDGREVLRRIRQSGNCTPIILLTQVGSPAERAVALDEGADDYLNKPFEPYELAARIKAVLRRSRPGVPSLAGACRLCSGPLELERQSRRVFLAGNEVALSTKAVSILE